MALCCKFRPTCQVLQIWSRRSKRRMLEPLLIQYIQVDKLAHILGGFPSRSSPRNCGKIKVRLRSGYGATVCALRYRCERRLEPRGLPKQASAPAFELRF